MREDVEHACFLVFFQCDWRVCSDGAAHKFAAIRASRPADAPFGRDMKCMRRVACATTRQWSAFFVLFSFFFVRSFEFELCQRHERLVVMYGGFAAF